MSVKQSLKNAEEAYVNEHAKYNGDHERALRAAISVYMLSMVGMRKGPTPDATPQSIEEHYLALVSGQDRRYVMTKALFDYNERRIICYCPDPEKSTLIPIFAEVLPKDNIIDFRGRRLDVEIDKTEA